MVQLTPSSSYSSSSPSSPLLSKLPDEVLHTILAQVRATSTASSYVTTCLLCCRRWRDVGLPLLYHAILLRNSNLETFLVRFNSQAYCAFVRYLTISINHELLHPAGPHVSLDMENIKQHGSSEAKALWGRLQELPRAIEKMANLSTLSFVVTRDKRPPTGFWIPRPIIASMVESLPKSCVNVEIDTRGDDYSGPGSGHLCDKLRDVLPRLRHLRLRLGTLCPAMFAAGFTVDGTIKDESTFNPEVASSLKTAIVNCVTRFPGYGGRARVCGTYKEYPYPRTYHNTPEARVALTKALRQLIARSNHYPAIERLWLLDMQYHDDNDSTVYAAYNRRDIIQNKTWAIPFRNITGVEKDGFLARVPEGRREIFSYQWAIETLAEGELWKETLDGCRMPAAAITTDGSSHGCSVPRPLPIESVESWRARRPKRMCVLWRNEQITGVRLLDAVEKEGLTDTSPVREITPNGWRRGGNDFLEPDEPR